MFLQKLRIRQERKKCIMPLGKKKHECQPLEVFDQTLLMKT